MENSLSFRLKSIFFPSGWCCAVRFNDDSETCLLNNLNDEFHVLNDSRRYWTADPFLAENNGKYYLFFEMFDRLKRKGVLGCREISKNGVGRLNKIYESDFHLSYPFIFKKDGEFYIIPESARSGELFILKCTDFPLKWEKAGVISKDKLVDTTLFSYDGTDYYISERVYEPNKFDRIDLFYNENGEFKQCKNNPVKLDAATARCAGKIFKYRDCYIRPSQDCSSSYGEKLNFNKIISVSKQGYEEESVTAVSVKSICLDRNESYTGIHTYNKLDNIEVIDLKTKNKFSLYNLAGVFYKAFHILKEKTV